MKPARLVSIDNISPPASAISCIIQRRAIAITMPVRTCFHVWLCRQPSLLLVVLRRLPRLQCLFSNVFLAAGQLVDQTGVADDAHGKHMVERGGRTKQPAKRGFSRNCCSLARKRLSSGSCKLMSVRQFVCANQHAVQLAHREHRCRDGCVGSRQPAAEATTRKAGTYYQPQNTAQNPSEIMC